MIIGLCKMIVYHMVFISKHLVCVQAFTLSVTYNVNSFGHCYHLLQFCGCPFSMASWKLVLNLHFLFKSMTIIINKM